MGQDQAGTWYTRLAARLLVVLITTSALTLVPATSALRPKFKLLLTGTPLQNNLGGFKVVRKAYSFMHVASPMLDMTSS
jgi:hypothetical protein